MVKNPESIVPIKEIQSFFESPVVLAFNRGTKSVEQKTTALGVEINSNQEFFIKYAVNSIARGNVNNEGTILKLLCDFNFVPKLQLHVNETNYTFIKTTVLKGVRLNSYPLNQKMIRILLLLSNQNIQFAKSNDQDIQYCFSHGDFCPWNMMDIEGTIQVYDWETAGSYPVGYDLFTYIFQTSFLLTPKVSVNKLIEKEKQLILYYFNTKGIEDWKEYLIQFSKIKLQKEIEKNNQRLIKHYLALNNYVEKT